MAEIGVNLPALIAYLVNFVILLLILYKFAYKPILRLLDQRAEKIRESLAAADQAREEAAQSRAAVEEQLNEARREGQRLLEQARQAAESFREVEAAKARQEAQAFVANAREEIQRERDAALSEVRRDFGDLAIFAAERIIRRSVDRQAHQDLVSQVLEEAESLRRN